ncbi:MAG: ABC-2 family transporter protein [archaeon]|jgi:ABC-2 type transport system permease protein
MSISKYYFITKTNFKNSFAYFYDSLFSAIFIALIVFVFANIWTVVFRANPTGVINGFTLQSMVWYLVVTEAILTSQGRIIIQIGNEMITGEIANYLNKPYNYLFYKYFSTIGSSITTFLITILVGGLTAFIFVGPVQINPIILPLIAISCLLGITLHFTLMSVLGIFALWIEDAHSLAWLYQKVVLVIGGTLAPLDIFPAWLSAICLVLPFSFITYYPAKLFVLFNLNEFIQVTIIQIAWIVGAIIFAQILFKVISKRVSINGG